MIFRLRLLHRMKPQYFCLNSIAYPKPTVELNQEVFKKMSFQSWRELEARIALDELPNLHRAFLKTRGIDTGGMPLRRIQQNVERELNKLVLEGRAQRHETDILLDDSVLDQGWMLDQV
jgi:hypothetical protein